MKSTIGIPLTALLILAAVMAVWHGAGDSPLAQPQTAVQLVKPLPITQQSQAPPKPAKLSQAERHADYQRHPNRKPELVVLLTTTQRTAALLNTPEGSVIGDFQLLDQLLREYAKVLGSVPVGGVNEEIVRRMQGKNPAGAAVLPARHPAISASGELLDRFGTPYFFHAESSHHLEIRSAGPDREMWTADDVTSTPD